MKKTSKKTKRTMAKRKSSAPKAPKLGFFGRLWKKISSM
jgi:hypothetical protein